jgi:spore germination cell wall hydrolase CwlJ-like protein
MIDVILFCLALNGYFEARDQSVEGIRAVMEVTITRAEVSGRDICSEVFLDKQFSWNHEIERPVVTNKVVWSKILSIAAEVFDEPTHHANGATHYHAIIWKGKLFPKPKWAYKLCECARIGNHVFYKSCEMKQ